MTQLLHADLTYKLRGIAFRVHRELCGGHEERVYDTAYAVALKAAGVPFQQQTVHRIDYRGQQVGEYRPDFMLEDGKLLTELKAAPKIDPLHRAQAISYLAVTKAELALIMNFGGSSMQIERIPNFLADRQLEEYSLHVPAADKHLYPELSQRVLDALAHVHRTLGAGFLHQVYRRATRIEFAHQQIDFTYVKELPVRYDGHLIEMQPVRLLHVEKKLLVAAVALTAVSATETERLRWAMNMTNSQLGLIVNFYGTRLQARFLRTA